MDERVRLLNQFRRLIRDLLFLETQFYPYFVLLIGRLLRELFSRSWKMCQGILCMSLRLGRTKL